MDAWIRRRGTITMKTETLKTLEKMARYYITRNTDPTKKEEYSGRPEYKAAYEELQESLKRRNGGYFDPPM